MQSLDANNADKPELIEELCTPNIGDRKRLKYKTLSQRSVFQRPSGNINHPDNFDVLRRVSAVLSQYVAKGLQRWGISTDPDIENKYVYLDRSVFQNRQKARPNDPSIKYAESAFTKHNHLLSISLGNRPRSIPSFCFIPVERRYLVPSTNDIFSFLTGVFDRIRIPPECSLVTLIYVDRLISMKNISLLPCNWRPVTLCALLLASKVWPDNTPTNEDFCSVYPQFDQEGFNDLESMFITDIQWNLLINSSTYAKYYFALRAIGEKANFRRRYNDLVHVQPEKSTSIERSTQKAAEELLSCSL